MAGILIVADIRLYREGLKMLLERDHRFDPVDSVASGDEAVVYLSARAPDAIVLDFAMQEGFGALRRISRIAGATPIIVLAVPQSELKVLACGEAGAAGFATRDASSGELIRTIDRALQGELDCSPRLAASMYRRLSDLAAAREAHQPLDALSARQTEILALIERGTCNKEIARTLGIKVATVKNHVHAILDRLHVGCRGEAAAMMRGRPIRPLVE